MQLDPASSLESSVPSFGMLSSSALCLLNREKEMILFEDWPINWHWPGSSFFFLLYFRRADDDCGLRGYAFDRAGKPFFSYDRERMRLAAGLDKWAKTIPWEKAILVS